MASEKLFEIYPPFPANVPTAHVPKFSLAKLLTGDATYAQELFETCRTVGFFLLDIGGGETSGQMSNDVDAMFDIGKEVFDLDVGEKAKYYSDVAKGSTTGWKPTGGTKVSNSGLPDRCEFWGIIQDDILHPSNPPTPNPSPISTAIPTITSYLRNAHRIIALILSVLDTGLGLPPGTLVSKVHPNIPSGTRIRLIRYPPQPALDRRDSLAKHTDMGAITFLCSVIGGLQLLTPGGDPDDESAWRYVRPEPRCAVINIGDALVEWSGGVLRSSMHRVTYAPGEQAEATRYSVAYLVRGGKDVSMKRLKSGRIPEEDLVGGDVGDRDVRCGVWEHEKTVALAGGRDCARSRGGREVVGLDGGKEGWGKWAEVRGGIRV